MDYKSENCGANIIKCMDWCINHYVCKNCELRKSDMKKVRIVIDVPEDVYRRLKAGDTNAGNTFHNTALEAIGNGKLYEERPKGKWISDRCGHFYKCSICGREIETEAFETPERNYPFCHCGADMRGNSNG